jgi:hypothetical protein
MLHLLVFAYWLGGDVGAFTASFTVTDRGQSPAARLAAARILNHVDMAPRSALILTLPTGLTLALQKGWIALPGEAVLVVWAASLVWLAALWSQHGAKQPNKIWRIADLSIRVALIAGLVVAVTLAPPLFLTIKFLCLSIATALGLAIRFAVAPMGPAIGQLAQGQASPDADRAVAQALRIARPLVVCIWICLLIAAWAGIAKPA